MFNPFWTNAPFPIFINLYFKTKHSNETFHLGFYSLLNVFSYIKHISSKSNISVLTISGKSRNMKIIATSPTTILLSNPPPPSFYGIVSIFPEGHLIMTTHFKTFFRNTHPLLIRPPLQLSTEE